MTPAEKRSDVIRRMVREAYLALSPAEEEQLARDVVGLLENVDLLAALEVEAKPPPSAVEPADLRADEVTPSLALEDALRNAPAAHDDFVSVPKVLSPPEKEEAE
ncbi:MAG: aspartyl/glutamyl-tRNA amidotransferase subunit C [Candidatus Coatesbacteria bacterium]|nr:MAG: aspartyl/glutamyl-tRNA amidotransferase subunit C [Candidatus Coatesbacteria bacterium]